MIPLKTSLKDKVIIVTGVGGKIGEAVFLELLRYKAIPVGVDISIKHGTIANKIGQVKEEILATKDNTTSEGFSLCTSDLTQAFSIPHVLNHATEKWGKINGVIHCAGSMALETFGYMTKETWDETILNNLYTAFYLTQSLCEYWVRTKLGGNIVLLSSGVALHGACGAAAYAAAKAGLIGLSGSIAKDMARYGVISNVVMPAVAGGMSALPEGQSYRTNQVVGLLCYLMTDDAKWITGKIYSCANGWIGEMQPGSVEYEIQLNTEWKMKDWARILRHVVV